MRFGSLLTIVALALASPAAAAPAATAAPEARMSEDEAQALRAALTRGRYIYAYDQAAWHGTDDLRAKMPDFAAQVGGWIVDGPVDAAEIVFFDRDQAEPQAVYVAKFEGQRLASSRLLGSGDDRTLSPARRAMIAARQRARQDLVEFGATRCKEAPMNTVVLPPQTAGEPTLVYFLTPQTSMEAIPMGGHYRVEVPPDGGAAKVRAFSNTCLELPLGEKGKKPEALMITHLLDPVPTEIHAFSSLAARLPIYVATTENGGLWAVEGTRARLLQRKD